MWVLSRGLWGLWEALPRHFNAESCVSLLSSTLLNPARPLHHLLHRLVVAQLELMHHLFPILNYSNLTVEKQLQ